MTIRADPKAPPSRKRSLRPRGFDAWSGEELDDWMAACPALQIAGEATG